MCAYSHSFNMHLCAVLKSSFGLSVPIDAVCIYMYVCIHVVMYVVCMHACIYACKCMCACMHVCMYNDVRAQNPGIIVYAYMYVCTTMFSIRTSFGPTCLCVCVYIYIHTNTHTHTHQEGLLLHPHTSTHAYIHSTGPSSTRCRL